MPNKAGQPTSYKEEYNEQAFNFCLLGLIDVEIAKLFGVCVATLNNWKKEHPKFLESLKDGREKANAKVARSLYERANGYSHPEEKILMADGVPVRMMTTKHYPPETKAAERFLFNRDPDRWRDKTQVEHTGEVTVLDWLKGKKEDE